MSSGIADTETRGTSSTARPGRPRQARIDAAVRDAVLALLAERGYAGATIAAVAARAGVGRGALYRRWRSKAEMVFAAAVHPSRLADPADLGSLEADLGALAERIHALSAGEAARAALTGLAADLATDPGLAATLETSVFEAERAHLATILARAVARGELGDGADADAAVETARRMLVGPIAFVPTYTRSGPTDTAAVAALLAAGLRTTRPPR